VLLHVKIERLNLDDSVAQSSVHALDRGFILVFHLGHLGAVAELVQLLVHLAERVLQSHDLRLGLRPFTLSLRATAIKLASKLLHLGSQSLFFLNKGFLGRLTRAFLRR